MRQCLVACRVSFILWSSCQPSSSVVEFPVAFHQQRIYARSSPNLFESPSLIVILMFRRTGWNLLHYFYFSSWTLDHSHSLYSLVSSSAGVCPPPPFQLLLNVSIWDWGRREGRGIFRLTRFIIGVDTIGPASAPPHDPSLSRRQFHCRPCLLCRDYR